MINSDHSKVGYNDGMMSDEELFEDDEMPQLHPDLDVEEKICLDVGGDRYHVRRSCLLRLPNTRLGKIAQCMTKNDAKDLCDIFYGDATPLEFFFDRNGDNFSAILGESALPL